MSATFAPSTPSPPVALPERPSEHHRAAMLDAARRVYESGRLRELRRLTSRRDAVRAASSVPPAELPSTVDR